VAEVDPREAVIERLARNPRLAHATFFAHRHPDVTPAFHYELIDLWHGPDPRVVVEAFRGAAKSTLAEEAIVIAACLRKFRNGLILGETFDRSVERLKSIKHEFEENPFIEELFGSLVGDTWTESRIVLNNGVCIQAVGRGQSLRGVKHLDARPDLAFGDDIENEESVLTPEARAKTMRWLMSVVFPALDPTYKVRINGTPLDPESMIVQISRDKGWVHRRFPWWFKDADGVSHATWPDRFPLDKIAETEASYQRLGLSTNYRQEYMCEAEDPAVKAFTADMFKVEPTVRTWHNTYAVFDPARTVKATSATTGIVVFSWVNNRLIVWESSGERLKPDQIMQEMFRIDEQYSPVVIGIEKDGLEEYLMQPLRQEQIRRGYAIPVRPLKAPKGKLDFIRALQPFFKAREIVFATEQPELKAQLLGFPTGFIDIPNALAYALVLRPGQAMYENFSHMNVADDIYKLARQPMFMAVNATSQCTTAVLVQIHDGVFSILWDGVREGDPGANLNSLVVEASLEAGQKPRLYAPPECFGNYDVIGLRGAARTIPIALSQSGFGLDGRDEMRAMLRRTVRGGPALKVSHKARWTLNALAGGYCRDVMKNGVLSEFAMDGPYKVIMEGLESLAALVKTGGVGEDQPINYQFTADGRRFVSSLAKRSAYSRTP
jgi:hypothetical protein